jgi:hypothetical protein
MKETTDSPRSYKICFFQSRDSMPDTETMGERTGTWNRRGLVTSFNWGATNERNDLRTRTLGVEIMRELSINILHVKFHMYRKDSQ